MREIKGCCEIKELYFNNLGTERDTGKRGNCIKRVVAKLIMYMCIWNGKGRGKRWVDITRL